MKIISKYHDYYDGVSKFGYDPNFYFNRNVLQLDNNSKVLDKINDLEFCIEFIHKNMSYSLSHLKIIFCGKIYSCLSVYIKDSLDWKIPANITHIYSKEQLDEFLKTCLLISDFKNEHKHDWAFKKLEKLFKSPKIEKLTDQEEEFFLDKNIVIAKFGDKKSITRIVDGKYTNIQQFIVNPILKDLQFYKILDANSAYQELEMYVSSALPKQHTMPINILDKDRVKQYGFDEWSFRKMPQKM